MQGMYRTVHCYRRHCNKRDCGNCKKVGIPKRNKMCEYLDVGWNANISVVNNMSYVTHTGTAI